ncbi:MAG: hypothetical protein JXL80_06135 [Planctomycetes bacterium]|nr:hypothetical protein [Planctomycetota bacterium]
MAIFALTIAATLAATGGAWAQSIDWGDHEDEDRNLSPEERRYTEIARVALSRLPFDVRRVDDLPDDLRGTAAIVPLGDKKLGLQASLYVPSTYDPVRPWPLLVEGRARLLAPVSLAEFYGHAEKHGFLLLAVEYLYFRGRNTAKVDVWTREGDGTIQPKERSGPDFLRDMSVDQDNLLALLRDVQSKYNVDSRAIGVTGFLHAAVMAYRLTLARPDLFCTAIARSGNFDPFFMPRISGPSKQRTIYIVYGENETSTLADSLQAATYFGRRGFKTVQSERIPNSGVDSRPEIAANFFQGTVLETLGPQQSELNRLCNLAVRCLDGKPNASPLQPDGQPHTAATILAALATFDEKQTEASLAAPCRFMMARLLAGKLNDRGRAEALLKGFLDQPLLGDSVAPQALLYLAEKVLDPKTQSKDAINVLGKVVPRRDTLPAVTRRAKALQDQLLQQKD